MPKSYARYVREHLGNVTRGERDPAVLRTGRALKDASAEMAREQGLGSSVHIHREIEVTTGFPWVVIQAGDGPSLMLTRRDVAMLRAALNSIDEHLEPQAGEPLALPTIYHGQVKTRWDASLAVALQTREKEPKDD